MDSFHVCPSFWGINVISPIFSYRWSLRYHSQGGDIPEILIDGNRKEIVDYLKRRETTMKKLFTIDDFMVAFIAAPGYGYGETIAKLFGLPKSMLHMLLSLVKGYPTLCK